MNILIEKGINYKIEFNKNSNNFELYVKEEDNYREVNSYRLYEDAQESLEKYNKRQEKLNKIKIEPVIILEDVSSNKDGFDEIKITNIVPERYGVSYWTSTNKKRSKKSLYGTYYKDTPKNREKLTKLKKLKDSYENKVDKIEKTLTEINKFEINKHFKLNEED